LQISARFPQATTLNHSVYSRRSPSEETQVRLEARLNDDRLAAGGVAHFGVAAKITDDHNLI